MNTLIRNNDWKGNEWVEERPRLVELIKDNALSQNKIVFFGVH